MMYPVDDAFQSNRVNGGRGAADSAARKKNNSNIGVGYCGYSFLSNPSHAANPALTTGDDN
jgi:hypothetical protein